MDLDAARTQPLDAHSHVLKCPNRGNTIFTGEETLYFGNALCYSPYHNRPMGYGLVPRRPDLTSQAAPWLNGYHSFRHSVVLLYG
jgi:hypothetical protein